MVSDFQRRLFIEQGSLFAANSISKSSNSRSCVDSEWARPVLPARILKAATFLLIKLSFYVNCNDYSSTESTVQFGGRKWGGGVFIPLSPPHWIRQCCPLAPSNKIRPTRRYCSKNFNWNSLPRLTDRCYSDFPRPRLFL